ALLDHVHHRATRGSPAHRTVQKPPHRTQAATGATGATGAPGATGTTGTTGATGATTSSCPSRRRAHVKGAAAPIDPVRSKTFTSSTWSGPAPASLAATHSASVFTPLWSRRPDGIVNSLCGPMSPM